MPAPILILDDLSKAYGATVAVGRVSFDIEAGEVHGLLGENGAGKSTIVKILSGTVRPDRGTVALDGAPYRPGSPSEARRAGVSTAFQELSLLANLTVAQNLMLPRQARGPLKLVSVRRGREAAAATLARYGLAHIHPALPVASLSLADRQRVEIVRAVSRSPRILVLDEPTASLSDPAWLFGLLEQLTAAGTGILYISHRLAEIRHLCRRATVLRNGESIRTVALDGVDDTGIFGLMVGKATRAAAVAVRTAPAEAVEAIAARDLSGGIVRSVSLAVRQGEIVGVAGLEGQGQRDLFRMFAGLLPPRSGEIRVGGRAVRIGSPGEAAAAGIGFVPEERKTEGLFLGLRTDANIALPILHRLGRFGLVDAAAEQAAVQGEATRVDLAPRYLRLRIGALSGGNQQKALIGRVLLSGARHLVLFDPTRGVDVGTKAVIYDVIRDFCDRGGSALLYSTELSELVQLVDRCLVIYRGAIAGEVERAHLSEERLVALAAGGGIR